MSRSSSTSRQVALVGITSTAEGKDVDSGERHLLAAVARGEWTSVEQFLSARSRYARFARATRRLREP